MKNSFMNFNKMKNFSNKINKIYTKIKSDFDK